MGYIADLASPRMKQAGNPRELWDRAFGTNKEAPRSPGSPPIPGGTWGRSAVTSEDAAIKRLLMAYRSSAPGGWSDDRYTETSKFIGAVYNCIHRSCEILSEAEFQVYIKDPRHQDGKRPITQDDRPHRDRMVRPYDLVDLLEKPNPEEGFGELMEGFNLQMDLTGTALTWIVPNRMGVPKELYPTPTAIAIPQAVTNPDYPQGYYRIQPVYPYGPFSTFPTPNSAVGAAIPAEWMMRMKYPHPLLRWDGYSPLTALNQHVDELVAMDTSRWYKMKNSSNPDAILNPDDTENLEPLGASEIDRIHAEWANTQQGPQNHGKLIVGTPHYKFDLLDGHNPKEMDYVNSWNQLLAFIMSGFGTTKSVTGMTDDASYATLFASLKQFHMLSLNPKCARFSRVITRKLAPFFGDDLIVEIKCARIDDHEVKERKLSLACNFGVLTNNQLLKELEFPTTNEEWGEERVVQGGQQQQPGMMPGMEGMSGQEMQGGMEQGGMEMPTEQTTGWDSMEEPEAENAPNPGNLNEGSLGPRKHLIAAMKGIEKKRRTKSIYNQVLEMTNGRH